MAREFNLSCQQFTFCFSCSLVEVDCNKIVVSDLRKGQMVDDSADDEIANFSPDYES